MSKSDAKKPGLDEPGSDEPGSDEPGSDEPGSEKPGKLSEEKRIQQAYNAAIRLLARRDHTTVELSRKLQLREHSVQSIEGALEELIELNYVNDARYAETYAEQRIAKGFGPLSVRAKLRERGLASHLVDAALKNQSVSWVELAQEQLQKRFDAEDILSREKRIESRLFRFLSQRGFSSADSLRALQAARKVVVAE